MYALSKDDRQAIVEVLANYGFEQIGFDESPFSLDLRIGSRDAEALVSILVANEEREDAYRFH